MSSPSQKTIKKISILSGNTCAFPKCTMSLVDEESGSITAQICHIKAKNSGGARYDSTQTNQERDAFENLILMCPVHHKVIDDDEESYPVERLEKIKANHESRIPESSEQGNLEKLLENYLRSITEKGNFPSDSLKTIKEENSSLIKAQKLAAEKTHNTRRQEWLYSQDGLLDGINSVNEIFSLIGHRISQNAETFTTLGIELNNQEKSLRCIYNYEFGCQVELKGFQEHSYDNKLANISLKVWLFKKRPSHQGGLFYTDAISRLSLKPDLTLDGQVIWKEEKNSSIILTAEGVCEKMFDLLVSQMRKKKFDSKKIEKDNYIKNNDYYDLG